MTSCPQCHIGQVRHTWRTDMATLSLIDEWKCLDDGCGHHWRTTIGYGDTGQQDEVRPMSGADT
jgi:hypothetical protein